MGTGRSCPALAVAEEEKCAEAEEGEEDDATDDAACDGASIVGLGGGGRRPGQGRGGGGGDGGGAGGGGGGCCAAGHVGQVLLGVSQRRSGVPYPIVHDMEEGPMRDAGSRGDRERVPARSQHAGGAIAGTRTHSQ